MKFRLNDVSQLAALLCALSVGAVFTGASASEGSKALVHKGIEMLEAQEFENAVRVFEYAVRSDPNDGEAHFFFGVAENRLRDGKEALSRIRRSRLLGYKHPRMVIEESYALLHLGNYINAIEALSSPTIADPQDPEVNYILGRAYFSTGQHGKAKVHLNVASQSSRLADNANLVLTWIANQENPDGSSLEGYFANILGQSPRSPIGTAVHDRATIKQSTSATKKEKPWRISIYAGGGYNDNVIALGEGVPLPNDISDEDSFVFEGGFAGAFDLLRDEDHTLSAGYTLNASKYESELDDSDLLLHSLYVAGRKRFDAHWSATFIANNQFAQLGGDNFRNQISLRPAVVYAHTKQTSFEGYIRLATENYQFDSNRFTDRDGETYAVGLNLYSVLGNSDWRYRAGIELYETRTDGSDFERNSTRFHTTLNGPLFDKLTFRGTFSYIQSNYDNPNSFTGLAFQRDDETLGINAGLQYPVALIVGTNSHLYLNYNFIDNDSNIGVYDYDQQSATAGLVISF